MSLPVGAPLAGTVQPLAAVPDAVFAGQLVGAGAAVQPPGGAGLLDVLAPVAGRLVKLHPHAFILLSASGTGVLVHVGIDTVTLDGAGFTARATEGDEVAAGQRVVTFDPAEVRGRGLSAVCPVVVLDSAPDSVCPDHPGAEVRPGELLYTWPGTG
ncbi:MAG TPA: PTS glucose transporter subunit IIA [Pseudonocardia sp.]